MVDDLQIDIQLVSVMDMDQNSIMNLSSTYIMPFNLTELPLMRIYVFRTKFEDYMLLDIHHIICDGISLGILFTELSEAYSGQELSNGKYQYKNYSSWQNKKDFSEHRKFWEKEYQTLVEPTKLLPYMEMGNSGKGDLCKIQLKIDTSKLEKICHNLRTTEFMVLFSAFLGFISMQNQENKVAVGTPFNGRNLPGMDNLIGMFVNTLPIICEVDAKMTFEELVERVTEKFWQVYRYQDYPMEEIFSNVNLKMPCKNLFNIVFTYQIIDFEKINFQDLSMEILPINTSDSKFDLSLIIEKKDGNYFATCEFRDEFCNREIIKKYVDRYAMFLRGICDAIDVSIGNILLLPPDEIQLLNSFNPIKSEIEARTIVDLFEEIVKTYPTNRAIEFEEQSMTYSELNAYSNSIAKKIREYGISSNDVVGILAKRSIEMIIAIYSVLKAGGTYLPILPDYPLERKKYLLKDANAKLLLISHQEFLEEYGLATICIHDEMFQDEKNLSCVNKPEDSIYIIYTSGTTGNPKGVIINNKNLLNMVQWQVKEGNINENSKLLQNFTYVFDGSVWEIFCSGLSGACLQVVNEEVQKDACRLSEIIYEKEITHALIVPSMLRVITEFMKSTGKIHLFSKIQKLYLGGEKLDEKLVNEFCSISEMGRDKLCNLYGPTEITVCATYANLVEGEQITIGYPIANTEVHIIKNEKLCGIGMPGELCIGGAGISKGYLNRDELTKEKFIDNPYGKGKMYCSGDLARWLPDGRIEYLGRIDDQVKIRGFRVELGEIENCLKSIDGIKDAVVTVYENGEDRRLSAYIIGNEINRSKIVREMKEKIPDYMIPSFITVLEKFPVLPNGKLDKSKLILDESNLIINEEYVSPNGETEEMVHAAFCKILGLNKISTVDSFFALGGHSIKATQLANLLSVKTGKQVFAKIIFQEKNIKNIAKLFDKEKRVNLEEMNINTNKKFAMNSVQRRLFTIQSNDNKSVLYNIPIVLVIQHIDIVKFRFAIQEMINRHSIFRTKFYYEKEKFMQSIIENVRFEVEQEFLSSNLEIDQIVGRFVQPFDLGKAPLMRVKVVHTDSGNTYLLFDFHHIIFDGGSTGVFFRELSALYEGATLEPLHFQYKDYSKWLEKQDYSIQERYWENMYQDGIPELELRTDYPRPSQRSFRGNHIDTALGNAVSGKVREFVSEHELTEYMLFLSAYALLLGEYTGQEDIVVGSPASGRTHPETQEMIGMFVNTLALRCQMNREQTVQEYLSEMKEKCLEAFDNQEYPFEMLVEKTGKGRDTSRNPIFDVMFTMQIGEEEHLKLGNASAEQIGYAQDIAKFDITLSVTEHAGKHTMNWEYCTDLYREESIRLMAGRYNSLVEWIVTNPDRKLKDAVTLFEGEQRRLVEDFNQTKKDYPAIGIAEAFAEEAQKHLTEMAVSDTEGSMTYKELDERSNWIAERLLEKGLRKEERVGVEAIRDKMAVAAFLGVLKAGGAYVPLDIKYPKERLRYILEDSGCKAIIGNGKNESGLEDGLEYIDWTASKREQRRPEKTKSAAEDLAYIIYTSGTTGEPKGVMIEQKSIQRLVKNTDYVDFDDIRILQTGTLAFDASTFEIWGALLNGGSVHIADEGTLSEPWRLKEEISRRRVNTMFITTALFNQMLNLDIEVFDGLTQLLFGGEATSEGQVKMLRSHNGKLQISNVYGPTETTTFATHYPIVVERGKTPIGKPIANTTAYVMRGEKLCGIGMPGELCIGGDGVARGYLNKPELTKERFIENPYVPGERIYRTGDLVRWLPDGNLEYLGRIDEQVKIRGFRIELGEIESRLREIDGVKEAAVVALDDGTGKYLSAYLVTGKALDTAEVKQILSEQMPEYMVPPYITYLDEMPVTKNGKLDKKRLPRPEAESSAAYRKPETKAECAVAETFEEILGGTNVGADDSFFELGGDSIKAIRIVSRLREKGYEANVRDIMQKKTVSRIAEELSGAGEAEEETQKEVQGEVLLTPIQREFFSKDLPEPWHFNQSFLLETEEAIDGEAIKRALHEVVVHHDMLRSVYRDGKQMIRGTADGELYGYVECEQSGRDLQEICSEVQRSFDLEKGPLLRAAVVHGKKKDWLLLCIHHLVVDGVSWRILLEDIMDGYRKGKAGEEIHLPAKTTSFQEWSRKQESYARSARLEEEESYWREIEEKICRGKLEKAETGETGIGTVKVELDPEVTEKLLYKAGRAYNTEINDLLLSALAEAVCGMTGKKDIAVSLEGHGREDILEGVAVDRTVGWFTSTYPVVLSAKGKTGETIKGVKEELRRVPNHGIGYGMLRWYQGILGKEEPDIVFNYLGRFEEGELEGGFRISQDPKGEEVSGKNLYSMAVSINGLEERGRLSFELTYEKSIHRREDMEELGRRYGEALKEIAIYCAERKETEHTASDYGEVGWSEEEFEEVKESLGKSGLEVERIYPLTAMQEGMLFHEIAGDKDTAYIVQSVYRTGKNFRPEYMERISKLLGTKHEMLRTSIMYKRVREPRQVLLKKRDIEYQYIDMRNVDDLEEKLTSYSKADIKRGFNLEEDSLLRISVIRCKEGEYRIYMCFHHIIMDGWCMSLLMNDIAQLYGQMLEGKEDQVILANMECVTGYEKYVRNQKKKDLKEGLKYWNEVLEGYEEQAMIKPEGIAEPTEEEVSIVTRRISKEDTETLEQIRRVHGITINTVIEAAWGILLQKYNNVKDVVYGKVVSGREEKIENVERMLGLFINTIPIRVELKSGESVVELLKRLQEQALKSMEYSYCPLAEIQKRSDLGSELIQSVFAFENYYEEDSWNDQLGLEIESAREQTNYPLSVTVYEQEGLVLNLYYDTEKYAKEEAERILRHFEVVIRQLSMNPGEEVDKLEVIGEDEKHLILETFNETKMPYPKEQSVIERFEEIVERYPDRVALEFGDDSMTYAELNGFANSIAQRLIKSGVQSGDVIGILAHRSFEMIISIYGVLKAGGTYAPVLPEYPKERIEYLLSDSKSKILLVSHSDLIGRYKIPIICVHDEMKMVSSNLKCKRDVDSAVYIIYTSGTTGEPKGVVISNKNLQNLVTWQLKEGNISENSKILQNFTYVFDGSVWEIFCSGLSGACLQLISDEDQKNVKNLLEIIYDKKISHMLIVPSMLRVMTDYIREYNLGFMFQYMERIYIGGEPLDKKLVDWFCESSRVSEEKLCNLYGPTEITVCATYSRIKKGKNVTIGKPIGNTQALVMQQGNICGIGMLGELYIGGEGVSQGYLGKDKLTREKFISHALNSSRLYRSGDLVRWLSNGEIEYLGRMDEQVKIRGFRVELGEIENTLRMIPTVKNAAVVICERASDKILGAYVVTSSLTEVEIREKLKKKLPSYMVPNFIALVEQLPTLPNGKIDKRKLPYRVLEEKEIVQPVTDIEKEVALLYESILGIRNISINESFVDIGGHSIKAMQVVNAIASIFSVQIQVVEIMKGGSVQEVAKFIEQNKDQVIGDTLDLEVEEE